MQKSPVNDRHGYVVHDACWCLLEKFLHPRAVPLARLLKICESLPFPLRGSGVSWGHNYGGLVLLDEKSHYPWEAQLIGQSDSSEVMDQARMNPYDVPEIPLLLKTRPQTPPGLGPLGQGNDCFSVLPWEILEVIAIYLSTRDALTLRLASRSFLPIFTSQTFWASRFGRGGDRDFIFEKRNGREKGDWRALYRLGNDIHSPPGLKNRRRVWALIRSFTDSLSLYLDDASKAAPIDLGHPGLQWIEQSGDRRHGPSSGYYARFDEGCRRFDKQRTSIPHDLSQLAVSTITVGGVEYVAGIRLVTGKDRDICLGYIAEGSELMLDVIALKGFVLAVGPRGIRALQVIGMDESISRWFGCPKGSPITRRLTNFESITALEVGFDVSVLL